MPEAVTSTEEGARTPEQNKQEAQALWDELDAEEAAAARGNPAPAKTEEEPAPKDVELQKEQQPQEKVAQTPAQPAGFSDEDRALLKQVPEMMNILKATVGRVGSLQSELAKIGHAAASQGAGEQPTSGQIDKASASPEAWKKLKEDFPDWAEGVEAYVATRVPSAPSFDFAELDRRMEERLTPLQRQRMEDAMEVVASIEPDWEKIKDAPEFAKWLTSKPADYQKVAGETWKPSQVLRILRDFKSESEAQPQQPKSQKLKAAEIPRGQQKAVIKKSVDEMSPQELWDAMDREEGVAPRRR